MIYTNLAYRFVFNSFIFFVGVLFLVSAPGKTFARIAEDVEIVTIEEGFEIEINFFLQLRYHTHHPEYKGDEFHIQLRPVSDEDLNNLNIREQLSNRDILSWNRSIPIPLVEMIYEGGTPDRPGLTLRFKQEVTFAVRSSVDFRSLIITIQIGKAANLETDIPEISSTDPKLSVLIEESHIAMIEEKYRRAIQIYTKILNLPHTELHKNAQELLGLARERNNQFAHAKAEYKKYLILYPEGPDAERVRQRLAGLLTARAKPKKKLREAKRKKVAEAGVWDTQIYGSFSEFYYYDITQYEGEDAKTNQSSLISDIDLNTRRRNDNYDIRTIFIGKYEEDFRSGKDDEARISRLSIDGKDRKRGLFGRIGRQSLNTGGVLGRFDGGRISYEYKPTIKIIGVTGFPVDSSKSSLDIDKSFFDLNLDLGTFAKHWDFNTFIINQRVDGITDRRAIGGEARYYESKKSFFSLMDIDISYAVVNMFLFNGNYTFFKKTRLNLVLDYRKSPLLTTSNALQGQGVEKIADLKEIYSEDEIRQLARDRTATSKSLTIGVTQDITENYQIAADITFSDLSTTVESGGVEVNSGTGVEYYYSLQFISSNILLEGDTAIIGLRYSDTMTNKAYSLQINARYPFFNRKLRISPRLRIRYRKKKKRGDDRIIIRPLARIDFFFRKWLWFELEGGSEYTNETVFGESEVSKGYFVSIGSIINF